MAKQFDVQAFKQAWREACAARGIDAENGATAYQVATARAEAVNAARRSRWWAANFSMWAFCPPYRSDVEAEALFLVFRAAYLAQFFREFSARRECFRREKGVSRTNGRNRLTDSQA